MTRVTVANRICVDRLAGSAAMWWSTSRRFVAVVLGSVRPSGSEAVPTSKTTSLHAANLSRGFHTDDVVDEFLCLRAHSGVESTIGHSQLPHSCPPRLPDRVRQARIVSDQPRNSTSDIHPRSKCGAAGMLPATQSIDLLGELRRCPIECVDTVYGSNATPIHDAQKFTVKTQRNSTLHVPFSTRYCPRTRPGWTQVDVC